MNKFTFKQFNANPKGKKASDCVLRAISVANNKSWEQTLKEMTELSLKTGYVFNEKNGYEKYLKNNGWAKCKMPKKSDNTKYTIKEFVERLAKNNQTYIISVCGHLTVVKNLELIDTWNCCNYNVGNFYTK